MPKTDTVVFAEEGVVGFARVPMNDVDDFSPLAQVDLRAPLSRSDDAAQRLPDVPDALQ